VAALAGPITLKTPGSEEWVIQMTAKALRVWMSLNDDTRTWRDTVARIDEQQVWKIYPKEKPYGTRDAYYRAELGAPEPELTLLKEVQQLQKQGRAEDALRDEKGRYLPKDSNADNVSFGHGNQAAYIRARLERDGKTELLAKIACGEISAHAAAVEAGFRQRMIQIAPTVAGFMRAATKHLSATERLALKEAL